MSALSKFFVVLVTIFAVAMVTLMVPFVINTQNYRGQIDDLKSQVSAAKASVLVWQRTIADVESKESERVAALNAKIALLDQSALQLLARVNDAEAESRKAAAELTQAKDAASTQAAAVERLTKIVEFAQNQMSTEQKEVLKIRTQLIEMIDRNEDLQGQVELLTRQVKFYQEDVTQLNALIARYEQGIQRLPADQRAVVIGGGTVVVDDAGTTPTELIQGKVTRVETVNEERFVQINVGSADRVRKNMRFLVHRGDEYLGSMIITIADEQTAVGRLSLVKAGAAINPGDDVSAGNRLRR